MNHRLPTHLASLCALIFITTAAPSFAQESPLPRDDSDEYAPHDPATDQYTHTPDPVHVDTTLQNNIKPAPASTVIDPANIQADPEPDAAPLISPLELQFAAHRLPPHNTFGFDIGVHGAYYFNQTMLNGWNGLDLTFRLGHIQRFSLLARFATPWTLFDTPNFNPAAGPGAECSTSPTYADSTRSPYFTPFLSLRLGIAAGSIQLRTEYDFHLVRNAHHLRAYLSLPFHLGLGLELALNRDNTPNLHLNQTATMLFIHF